MRMDGPDRLRIWAIIFEHRFQTSTAQMLGDIEFGKMADTPSCQRRRHDRCAAIASPAGPWPQDLVLPFHLEMPRWRRTQKAPVPFKVGDLGGPPRRPEIVRSRTGAGGTVPDLDTAHPAVRKFSGAKSQIITFGHQIDHPVCEFDMDLHIRI